MNGRVASRTDLTGRERQDMLALLTRHFTGVGWGRFEADLAEKDHVILLEDERGGLRGFSTLKVYETPWQNRTVEVLCSGDTIVEPAAWGSTTLARTWLEAVVTISRRFFSGGLYWLLICSGYRTYRFLPVFWKSFYPRPGLAVPPETRELRDHLAMHRWGTAYRSDLGIVRFDAAQRLRSGISPLTSERLRDPYVRHFVRQNPGHDRGDELVCLTELRPDNLTRAGRRVLRSLASKASLQEAVG